MRTQAEQEAMDRARQCATYHHDSHTMRSGEDLCSLAALVLRLEARLESAEMVVELGIGLASWAASAKPRPANNTNEWMTGLIVRRHNFAVASDAHSAAKEPKP